MRRRRRFRPSISTPSGSAKPSYSPALWYPRISRFTIAIQIWILKRGNDVVIIDTGVGNHKVRPPARMHMLNTLVPQWLAAAGAEPDVVTHVLITHLHCRPYWLEHQSCEDQRWAPTFPKARYLVPKTDYDYFKGLNDSGKAGDTSFADSLAPIIDAGLVDLRRTSPASCPAASSRPRPSAIRQGR